MNHEKDISTLCLKHYGNTLVRGLWTRVNYINGIYHFKSYVKFNFGASLTNRQVREIFNLLMVYSEYGLCNEYVSFIVEDQEGNRFRIELRDWFEVLRHITKIPHPLEPIWSKWFRDFKNSIYPSRHYLECRKLITEAGTYKKSF